MNSEGSTYRRPKVLSNRKFMNIHGELPKLIELKMIECLLYFLDICLKEKRIDLKKMQFEISLKHFHFFMEEVSVKVEGAGTLNEMCESIGSYYSNTASFSTHVDDNSEKCLKLFESITVIESKKCLEVIVSPSFLELYDNGGCSNPSVEALREMKTTTDFLLYQFVICNLNVKEGTLNMEYEEVEKFMERLGYSDEEFLKSYE